jgi:hypothetical protein
VGLYRTILELFSAYNRQKPSNYIQIQLLYPHTNPYIPILDPSMSLAKMGL